MINFGVRWRLAWFATAIVCVALAILWTARVTWEEARNLDKSIGLVQVQSFQIADHFQATIWDLNLLLSEYLKTLNPTALDNFVREGNALDRWIDEQSNLLTNPNEKRILDRINNAYDAYRDDALRFTNQVASAAFGPGPVNEALERAERQCKGLFRLGNELADVHREKVGDLITHIQRSLNATQQLIFTLLVVLLALGAWVGVVVYRDMIAPLRVKLVETRALVERQEKLASLGVLAAGVAHEIRNPLTAVKARLYTQQKRLPPGSPEAEDALVINKEINRLERIVRDVLQFARPAEPNRMRVSVRAMLEEVRELLGPPLEKQGIQLLLETSVATEVLADLQQIKQVLINLVQNAADSIGHTGTITLRARLGSNRLQGAAGAVVLEVEDTGKGIPPEVQKRLFDPFFTTKESGTGLGLAIAARIVEKHGGVLEFQTLMNRGSVFGIVLPECR